MAAKLTLVILQDVIHQKRAQYISLNRLRNRGVVGSVLTLANLVFCHSFIFMKALTIVFPLIILSFYGYSQDTNYIKLIREDFSKVYKHRKKIFQENDTLRIWAEYNKKTKSLVSVHFQVRQPFQIVVYFNFGTNGKVWIRVLERLAKKVNGAGEYYFIHGRLVASQKNNLLTKDYSYLIVQSDYYRQWGETMMDKSN